MLPAKSSSNDDFSHDFGAEASLPLTQSAPAVTADTTRFCWIDVTLWDCHIHTDAVYLLCICFCLMEKVHDLSEYRGWFGNETSASSFHRKYVGYFWRFILSGPHIFFNLRFCTQSKFSSKGPVNSITIFF